MSKPSYSRLVILLIPSGSSLARGTDKPRGARSFELRAATSLARLMADEGRILEAHDLLVQHLPFHAGAPKSAPHALSSVSMITLLGVRPKAYPGIAPAITRRLNTYSFCVTKSAKG